MSLFEFMTPRNIHFTTDEISAEESNSPEGSKQAKPALPRLRSVTNDPLREYAARPGVVRPLPDAVAALILSRKGKCIVENHQIVASVGGVERVYSSRDSVVIAELNGTKIPVYWLINRRKPDCLHLVSKNGEYLETLPLKADGQWFSNDAVSQEAMAAAVSHRKRDARRLAELHAPDAAAALAREQHNAGEIERKVREDERTVHIFPASPDSTTTFPTTTPGSDRRSDSDADTAQETIAPGHRRGTFPKAERFCAAEAAVERARGRRASTKSEAARHAARAADITKLFTTGEEEPEPGPAKAPRSLEDFLR